MESHIHSPQRKHRIAQISVGYFKRERIDNRMSIGVVGEVYPVLINCFNAIQIVAHDIGSVVGVILSLMWNVHIVAVVHVITQPDQRAGVYYAQLRQ